MAPPNVDNMITLKVDNVPFTIAADELRELFDKFGEIGDVYIPRARGSSESRGFAFVRFMNRRDAEDAIEGMEGKEFQGRELRVQFAKQRRPDNPREYYSTRDGRGYDDAPRDRDRDRGYDDRGRDRYDDRDRDRDRDRYDDRRRSRSPDRSRDRDSARGGGSYRERSRSPPRRRSRSPPRRRSPSPRRD